MGLAPTGTKRPEDGAEIRRAAATPGEKTQDALGAISRAIIGQIGPVVHGGGSAAASPSRPRVVWRTTRRRNGAVPTSRPERSGGKRSGRTRADRPWPAVFLLQESAGALPFSIL